MIQIRLTATKSFMSKLLLSDHFDDFQCIEGEIITFNTFHIDGFTQKSYYEENANLPEYSPWSTLKGFALDLIKGKRPPVSFKFIFRLPQHNLQHLITDYHLDFKPEHVQGLYLNIRYEADLLLCTTGTASKTFTLDKSLEQAWDKEALHLFDTLDIPYEQE
ncbi:MAG: DUF5721 family protein [Lachnospiraceae bacterium]|nr:DUF5721 family protein [Lachnospiraceae bacterium]